MGSDIVRAELRKSKLHQYNCASRVPTGSGNHGKPGESQKKVPGMEKSWNLKKPE